MAGPSTRKNARRQDTSMADTMHLPPRPWPRRGRYCHLLAMSPSKIYHPRDRIPAETEASPPDWPLWGRTFGMAATEWMSRLRRTHNLASQCAGRVWNGGGETTVRLGKPAAREESGLLEMKRKRSGSGNRFTYCGVISRWPIGRWLIFKHHLHVLACSDLPNSSEPVTHDW